MPLKFLTKGKVRNILSVLTPIKWNPLCWLMTRKRATRKGTIFVWILRQPRIVRVWKLRWPMKLVRQGSRVLILLLFSLALWLQATTFLWGGRLNVHWWRGQVKGKIASRYSKRTKTLQNVHGPYRHGWACMCHWIKNHIPVLMIPSVWRSIESD